MINKKVIGFVILFLVLAVFVNLSFGNSQSNLKQEAELKVTLEHPFLIEDEWIEASELQKGDLLTTIEGKKAKIISIEKVSVPGGVEVYNLEDDFGINNYVVGDGGVVVHNSGLTTVKPCEQCWRQCPEGWNPKCGGLAPIKGEIIVKSRIKEHGGLIRAAESLSGTPAQKDVNHLLLELSKGNLNPGIGGQTLECGLRYARASHGGRIFFRMANKNDNLVIEILGKADKHNEARVINLIRKLF